MHGLGAYYAWDSAHEPVQPVTPAPGTGVSGLGAYYAWDSAHEPVLPINGLGGSGEQQLSDEAARHLLDKREPLAVAREWARQQTDILWRELPGDATLTLLPLANGDIKRIQQAAHGAELAAVGILRSSPRMLADQDLALAGTPYVRALSLALYSIADGGRVARPMFLTIATLRGPDDRDGGHDSVGRAASRLGGRLVYVISLPTAAGTRGPGARFQEVFAKLGAMGAEPAAPDAPPPVAAPSPLSLTPYFAAGALAAGGLWWLLAHRH